MIAAGDYFAVQVAYSEGAAEVHLQPPRLQLRFVFRAARRSATASDRAVCTARSRRRSPADDRLGRGGGWEHFWTPALRTSMHGGYVERPTMRRRTPSLCAAQPVRRRYPTLHCGRCIGVGDLQQQLVAWQIGSRTQWNVTKDVLHGRRRAVPEAQHRLRGRCCVVTGAFGGQPAACARSKTRTTGAVRARWHRDLP